MLKNGHLQTIWPNLRRSFDRASYQRERIETKDGDFLDLDWLRADGATETVILSHGLEASSQAGYVARFAKRLHRDGFNVLAWNFRGCSGEPNRHLPSYHSGKSEDLACVVDHVLHAYSPQPLSLVGFSMGGNITLKYLGESGSCAPIARAAVCSVPIDLENCAYTLAKPENTIYMKRFLRYFYANLQQKKKLYPELDLSNFDRVKTFYDFDTRFTAPLNGFKSAHDYWRFSSSLHYLSDIKVPVLIMSAYDDPFLSDSSYPTVENEYVHTVYSDHGGHLGFMNDALGRSYWNEEVMAGYISNEI